MLDNSNPWFYGCVETICCWTVGKGATTGNDGVVAKGGWVTLFCVTTTGWGWGNGRDVDGVGVGVTGVVTVDGVVVVGTEVNRLAVFPHG